MWRCPAAYGWRRDTGRSGSASIALVKLPCIQLQRVCSRTCGSLTEHIWQALAGMDPRLCRLQPACKDVMHSRHYKPLRAEPCYAIDPVQIPMHRSVPRSPTEAAVDMTQHWPPLRANSWLTGRAPPARRSDVVHLQPCNSNRSRPSALRWCRYSTTLEFAAWSRGGPSDRRIRNDDATRSFACC